MRAVSLLSGGLDSATSTWWALEQGWDVTALTFHYVDRPRAEIESTRRIAQRAALPLVEVDLPWMQEASEQARGNERLASTPDGYIPARNAIFYAIAAYHAEILGAERIVGGHNGCDPRRFPDSARAFFDDLGTLIRRGLASGTPVHFVQPLLGSSKEEVLRWALKVGAPVELTWSCYEQAERPCGACPSCIERAQAFAGVGLEDPARA